MYTHISKESDYFTSIMANYRYTLLFIINDVNAATGIFEKNLVLPLKTK